MCITTYKRTTASMLIHIEIFRNETSPPNPTPMTPATQCWGCVLFQMCLHVPLNKSVFLILVGVILWHFHKTTVRETIPTQCG